ncbi:MAG TPA: ABC transporter permease [Polyangiales bacterium]|nr:ABC transporter permease [Polyangiales bacterium]
MKALTRKLFRDIGNMRGAVFTISLVVAAGIAAFVTLRGTYLSIVETRDIYYSRQRFGDVFSQLERAPLAIADKIEALPGVARVYTRVGGTARVPLASLEEPAEGRVVSIPDEGPPPMNGIALLAGRMPRADRDDEALLIELFAEKHGVHPGDTLRVIVEGRERTIRVVGLAMSPEFVLAVPNGASAPAPERFAVFWMPRSAVESVFDMRAAFNDLVLDLAPGTDPEHVIPKLDELLDDYGGLGAQSRERQVSNYFLTQDLGQLSTLATIAPLIFLGVAAFLLNVVLSRLIELDRPQIATLKAIGYSDREVGVHYLQLTLIITLLGAAGGIAAGAYLGQHMTALYQTFYRMPSLNFHIDRGLFVGAVMVSLIAGIVGSAISVYRVILLPPAEAMRPAAPPNYAQGTFGRVITRRLGTAARMVAREISRRPMRTLLSAAGIGAATGIIVVGQHFTDAMDYLVDFYIQAQQRETVAVNFVNPMSEDGASGLKGLPGVLDVQWVKVMAVRVRAGHRERTVSLVAHPSRHSMRPLLDAKGSELAIEPGSVIFTDMLAKVLHVKPGDSVVAEPLIGDRTPRKLRLSGTVSELIALWIHMTGDDFADWLGTAGLVTGAVLQIDPKYLETVQDELLKMPQVASASRKELIVDEFRKQQGQTMGTFSLVLTLFAVTIAVSVVYNNARVALSLRGRELASLRVLGFTRGEISSVLIGELGVQVLVGIPFGLYFGRLLVMGMVAANDPESFRFPDTVAPHSFAVAALVTVLASIASALLVRRKLDQLDLVEVLKTRE